MHPNTTYYTYAAVSDDTITHLSGELGTDSDAQRWHASLGNPGVLVVLDIADDEAPSVGDLVDVDEDGVATLAGIGGMR